jgi:hypothetical protein
MIKIEHEMHLLSPNCLFQMITIIHMRRFSSKQDYIQKYLQQITSFFYIFDNK